MIAAFWCWESPLYEAVLALKVLITDRQEFFPAQAISKRGIGVVEHSHSEVHYACISLSCTQHLDCSLSDTYPLSSTQRCWTYRPHTAHARERQQCSAVTDTLGIAACEH